MSLFGCASDEQYLDELTEEIINLDFDLHYCEYHDSYYCPEIESCNPDNLCFPAINHCRLYRSNNV